MKRQSRFPFHIVEIRGEFLSGVKERRRMNFPIIAVTQSRLNDFY